MDSKIAEITRTPGSTKLKLKFQYDALGNRVAKHTFAANGIWRTSEFYVRDASGNLSSSYCLRQRTIRDANPDRNVSGMATYKHYPQAQEMHYQLTERHIYGSARIGTENSCLELIANSTEIDIREFSRTINLKSYEISNHLGNVISTVSDLKIPVDISNDNITDSYSAIIISATDYSPFVAALESRSFNKEMYRFGFNGKELDNSTASDNYDFGARILDCRLGRWSSVDPLVAKYPSHSGFVFAINSPLLYRDPDGKKIRCATVEDAIRLQQAILEVLGSSEVLASMFIIGEDGVTFENINIDDFLSEVQKLNKDVQNVANGLMRAVNSKSIIHVHFAEDEEDIESLTCGSDIKKGRDLRPSINGRHLFGGQTCSKSMEYDEKSRTYNDLINVTFNESAFDEVIDCPNTIATCNTDQLVHVNPNAIIVGGVVGALLVYPDKYIKSKMNRLNIKAPDEKNSKAYFGEKMLQAQNTICRILGCAQLHGYARWNSAHNFDESERIKEYDLIPPASPRDLKFETH